MMKVGLNPSNFSSGRKKLSRSRNDRSKSSGHWIPIAILSRLPLLLFLLCPAYIIAVLNYGAFASTPIISNLRQSESSSQTGRTPGTLQDTCKFRKYPRRRYYGLPQTELPKFLKMEYIYGQLPQLLKAKSGSNTNKLCVDQAEWYRDSERLPFADGTNPSLLKIKNNSRLDPSATGHFPEDAHYLATICMTNSQCAWKETAEEQEEFKLSTQEEPSTVRTVLLVLNNKFETIQENTVHTLIDAPFGRRIRPKSSNDFEKKSFSLDDARLFTHQGEIWVSYREGKIFGYDKQVLNRLHVTTSGKESIEFTLKASEVETLCCGRNMALIDSDHTAELQALTWVDPITVVDVELKLKQTSARQLLELGHDASSQKRRQLTARNEKQERKSHFHGTNGFMVHLPDSKEFIGIGHFHRPPSRDFGNAFARFGHHYTHAFFTIPDQPPFHLKRLSPELVLPSHNYPDDGEIIQFWSGLELIDDKTLALSYGINDCEGAATYLDMSTVDGLLRDVPEGKEVVDLMKSL